MWHENEYILSGDPTTIGAYTFPKLKNGLVKSLFEKARLIKMELDYQADRH